MPQTVEKLTTTHTLLAWGLDYTKTIWKQKHVLWNIMGTSHHIANVIHHFKIVVHCMR